MIPAIAETGADAFVLPAQLTEQAQSAYLTAAIMYLDVYESEAATAALRDPSSDSNDAQTSLIHTRYTYHATAQCGVPVWIPALGPCRLMSDAVLPTLCVHDGSPSRASSVYRDSLISPLTQWRVDTSLR